MADQPQRPGFKDGQPLAAADLDLVVNHARNRADRHERTLHTLGIALGLQLNTTDLPMSANGRTVITKTVTIAAGLALDGYGRQILIANDEPLRPEQFEDDVGGPIEIDHGIDGGTTTYPYPVLLTADDRDGPTPAFATGACGTSAGSTRTIEDYQVMIGRRGDHLTLGAQTPLGPGDAVDDGTPPFRVLLGFVRFHTGLRRFVERSYELDNVRPRRAGVRAGEVVTGGDRLLLRVGEREAPGQPALELAATSGGRLMFGPTLPDGTVNDMFSVSAEGNVVVRGTLDAHQTTGALRMRSGVVTDGLPLPLPAGVSEDDVSKGNVVLHAWVTPRFPDGGAASFSVSRCDVDRRRVVHCRLVRLSSNLNGTSVRMQIEQVAACNFFLVAIAVATSNHSGAAP